MDIPLNEHRNPDSHDNDHREFVVLCDFYGANCVRVDSWGIEIRGRNQETLFKYNLRQPGAIKIDNYICYVSGGQIVYQDKHGIYWGIPVQALEGKIPVHLTKNFIKINSEKIDKQLLKRLHGTEIEDTWCEKPHDAEKDTSQAELRSPRRNPTYSELLNVLPIDLPPNMVISTRFEKDVENLSDTLFTRAQEESLEMHERAALIFWALEEYSEHSEAQEYAEKLLQDTYKNIFDTLCVLIETGEGEIMLTQMMKELRKIPPQDRAYWCMLFSQTKHSKKTKEKIQKTIPFRHKKLQELEQAQNEYGEGTYLDLIAPHIGWMQLNEGCSIQCPFCVYEPGKIDRSKQFHISDITRLLSLYESFRPAFYRGSDPIDYKSEICGDAVDYFDIQNIAMLMGHLPYVSTAIPTNSVKLVQENYPLIHRVSGTFMNERRVGRLPRLPYGSAYRYFTRYACGKKEIKINWSGKEIPTQLQVDAIIDHGSSVSCLNCVSIHPDGSIYNEVNLNRNYLEYGISTGNIQVPVDFRRETFLNVSDDKIDPEGCEILKRLLPGCIVMKDSVIEPSTKNIRSCYGRNAVPLRIQHFNGRKRYYVYSPQYEIASGVEREIFIPFSEKKYRECFG